MARKSLTSAEAAAWATVAYVAKIRLQRQEIARGSYDTDLRLVGTVAGHEIDIPIVGEGVQSGPQTTASSTGPSKEELVAWGTRGWSKERFQREVDEAAALYGEEERLPGVTDEDLARVKPFIKRCRASTTTTKRGAYTFAEAPDPDDLENAIRREAA